ncbi:MAG: DNA topoisomerase IB [bacterium]|nr:DNA topoisomerase IB [bacterium]
MIKTSKEIKLTKSIIKNAVKDPASSAQSVNLIYVSEKHLSIERTGNKTFTYTEDGIKIKEEKILERIKKLVLPPAWTGVKICRLDNGHLQATGFDILGRKQYRYHSLWSKIRNHTKFYRLLEFGKQMPIIRKQLEKDLALPGYPREKVLAAVVTLLELTNIRVGNSSYEKLYGSFGLSTLKNHHVAFKGSKLIFSFVGKKGIKHKISLKSKRLSKIVKGCKDIPGKELFEYVDDEGVVHNVDSGMINEYIRTLSGGDFTAKDFRTWAGTVQSVSAFKEAGDFSTEKEMKQKVNSVFENVALQLGNTKAVCKKYYVHPVIVKLYEDKKLDAYLKNLIVTEEVNDEHKALTAEEKILMKILQEN